LERLTRERRADCEAGDIAVIGIIAMLDDERERQYARWKKTVGRTFDWAQE
jgi:hypothetical protein